MRDIEWKYVKKLQNEESLSIFEKLSNTVIPNDIRKCIVNYNGGRPSRKVFDTKQNKERMIKSLLSYNTNDLETVYDAYNVISETNKTLIPIASDPAGNYICFDKRSSKIVLWLHETNAVEEIADTFADFLNGLY